MAAQVTDYERKWADGMSRGDLDVADEVFAADCIIHVTGFAEPIRGVGAWKNAARGFITAFPGLRISIDEQVVSGDGDTVVTRWHANAKHTGPFGPIPPTGRDIVIDGLILDHLRNGKVVERWEQFDQTLILQQMGIG